MSQIDKTELMDHCVRYSYEGAAPMNNLGLVLLRMIEGKARAGNGSSDYMPTLIISSTRTLKDGSRARRGFYVDYRNPVQVTRSDGIERAVRAALNSGDNLKIQDVYAELLEYTRSRYE